MKDKTSAKEKICTAGGGFKFPIALIVKEKNSTCFQLLDPGVENPLTCKNQKNACFDKEITVWWILNLF